MGSLILGLVVALSFARPGLSEDWGQWRGPQRNGSVRGFQSLGKWPKELTLVWEQKTGRGDASPLIVGDRVFTWTREGEDEVAAARDRADGSLIWKERFHSPQTKPIAAVGEHAAGPFSTPAYLEGRLFTFGVGGQVIAWNSTTGKRIWMRDFDLEFRPSRPFYGASQSPLVTEGKVLLSVGGAAGGALIAFDPDTGSDIWRLEIEGPSYGSGVLAEIGGQEILVTPTRKRLIGVAVESGQQLWEFPFEVSFDDWALTPLVFGQRVLISTGLGPTVALEITREAGEWSVQERWRTNEYWLRFSSPVLAGERILAFAEQKKGHLVAADPATGRLLWEGEPRQGEASWLLSTGDLLLVVHNEGTLDVFAVADSIERVAHYDDLSKSPIWAHPALVGQHLVIKDADTLRCFVIAPSLER